MIPHSAIQNNTSNGKSRNINIGDIHLTDPLDIIEIENIPIKTGEEKQNFIKKESLPDLKIAGVTDSNYNQD